MSDWVETMEKPVVPLRRATATSYKGDVVVRDCGEPSGPHIAADCHWGTHVHWDTCWTTEARARRIGEMALRHLRELEAEIAAMDDLPINATDRTEVTQ